MVMAVTFPTNSGKLKKWPPESLGIEPAFESWETCAASRRYKSAIRQSEKQGQREQGTDPRRMRQSF